MSQSFPEAMIFEDQLHGIKKNATMNFPLNPAAFVSGCVLKKRIHCTIQDMGIESQDLLWWEDMFHVETHKIRKISLIEEKL